MVGEYVAHKADMGLKRPYIGLLAAKMAFICQIGLQIASSMLLHNSRL